jgi:hypothetical protein
MVKRSDVPPEFPLLVIRSLSLFGTDKNKAKPGLPGL